MSWINYTQYKKAPTFALCHFQRIRHTLTNSKDKDNQDFIFEFLDRFRGFITAALGQTYRFQIFLASSVLPEGESRDHFPYGVWEVVEWIVNQLEPVYRVQAQRQLEQDQADLEQLKKDIDEGLLRDKEAYADFEAVCKQKEKRIDSTKERMRTALEEALNLAGLQPVTDTLDPVPFTIRRRMVQQAVDRLEQQIAYLTEWRDHLAHIELEPAALPRNGKKATIGSIGSIPSTVQRSWAS